MAGRGEIMGERTILGKVIIKGKIELLTGLHIGGADMGITIGGLDARVIRDPMSNQPYIPGSSLKGKMRSLLERSLDLEFNRHGGSGVYRHECSKEDCPVCRLFGSTKGQEPDSRNIPSKLIVRDAFLTEESEEELRNLDTDLPYTEWKTENALDRVTAAANPRSIERVPKGAKFEFEMIYTAETKNHIKEDLTYLFSVMALLEDEYLGKGGSRGNGKVKFKIESIEVRTKNYYLTGEEKEKHAILEDGKTCTPLEARDKADEIALYFTNSG